MAGQFKLFSDPVHGFISVPRTLILPLIQMPEVQRLRRIRQLGVGHLVFPGAEHTRFGHALGAMALMQQTLGTLSEKGTEIAPEEQLAALAAALLHDIGHGPFSHTLEHELIADFHHEDMSRKLLDRLNARVDGALDLAIHIFDNTYERPFFHQLVSSQLDMDRLDYLRRDSFFSGVAEGSVGVARIIKTLHVHRTESGAEQIVIEAKGRYAVENFLIARRLMYWQVYMHKTVLAGDQLLRAILRRARVHLRSSNNALRKATSPAFRFFLEQDVHRTDLDNPAVLDAFCALDDTDVLYSLKQWMGHSDRVFADLCRRFVDRDFFRVTFLAETPSPDQLATWRSHVADWLRTNDLSSTSTAENDATLYLTFDESRHKGYKEASDSILLLERTGTLTELSSAEEGLGIRALTHFEVKPYLCYPKDVTLDLSDWT